ncbi:MAG: phosphoenolpyruvate--protein phosphotransferase [Bacteriovorax sp.]|nr:phosphoenolpyruvate--protein phosphotransferase [Bacteriovorax sp.]
MIKGISAAPGVVIGIALTITEEELVIPKFISTFDLEEARLGQAIQSAKLELNSLRAKTLETLGDDKAQIFDAHMMILEDPELLKQTLTKIKKESVNAEYALNAVANQFIAVFEGLEDAYLKERASDVRDVTSRLLCTLLKKKKISLENLSEPVILITRDLTPSQTASMDRKNVLGFLTDIGGKTSHTAIMARTLEIPAIVGLGNFSATVKDGDRIAFDGETGEVKINPTSEQIEFFTSRHNAFLEKKKEQDLMIGLESKTLDGFHIELAGNIGTPRDLDALHRNDAEAVGLYRTEFLFMDRNSMPSEDEQYHAYSEVIKGLKGKNCIIRTLDIGGDKKLSYLDIGEEANPFLGYRAIRICLREPELFKTQLRALLRASIHGPLSIMFPMISSLEEILAVKTIWNEVKAELNEKLVPFALDIQLGIMIEIPSAAIISDILADHVDFFSIGTNDLTQYTCAVDRMNEKIEYLYNPYNPGLLRLIHMTIKNARAKNKMVGICGSMAHQKDLVPLFVGMGVSELSMSAMHILSTRKIIRKLVKSDCEKLVIEFLKLGTADEVKKLLN